MLCSSMAASACGPASAGGSAPTPSGGGTPRGPTTGRSWPSTWRPTNARLRCAWRSATSTPSVLTGRSAASSRAAAETSTLCRGFGVQPNSLPLVLPPQMAPSPAGLGRCLWMRRAQTLLAEARRSSSRSSTSQQPTAPTHCCCSPRQKTLRCSLSARWTRSWRSSGASWDERVLASSSPRRSRARQRRPLRRCLWGRPTPALAWRPSSLTTACWARSAHWSATRRTNGIQATARGAGGSRWSSSWASCAAHSSKLFVRASAGMPPSSGRTRCCRA
mmetsp:Transcript_47707/g.139024  ORF Transcript_47707/g.139024 Transcript_47707/m.139024 type:complete len:276 (-) Transcript_47707:676-1503(-)